MSSCIIHHEKVYHLKSLCNTSRANYVVYNSRSYQCWNGCSAIEYTIQIYEISTFQINLSFTPFQFSSWVRFVVLTNDVYQAQILGILIFRNRPTSSFAWIAWQIPIQVILTMHNWFVWFYVWFDIEFWEWFVVIGFVKDTIAIFRNIW